MAHVKIQMGLEKMKTKRTMAIVVLRCFVNMMSAAAISAIVGYWRQCSADWVAHKRTTQVVSERERELTAESELKAIELAGKHTDMVKALLEATGVSSCIVQMSLMQAVCDRQLASMESALNDAFEQKVRAAIIILLS